MDGHRVPYAAFVSKGTDREHEARNACAGVGPNSGQARLWFGDAGANSRLVVTTGSSTTTYYLQDGFWLSTAPGSGKDSIVVESGAQCSPFKTFGTWTTIVQ